jgi:hypothetical protein
MNLLKFVLAAAVVVPPIAVASAQDAAPGAAQPQRKERQICRREPVTGTRIRGARVCMTKAQWDEISENARQDLMTSNNRPHVKSSLCLPGMAC